MNINLIAAIIGSAAVVGVAAVGAARYVGSIEATLEALPTAEKVQMDVETQVEGLFDEWANKIRSPGDQLGFDGPFGVWSAPLYCPVNEYVCGIRQKLEGRQGNGDDTAMNAVRFYCCPLSPVD